MQPGLAGSEGWAGCDGVDWWNSEGWSPAAWSIPQAPSIPCPPPSWAPLNAPSLSLSLKAGFNSRCDLWPSVSDWRATMEALTSYKTDLRLVLRQQRPVIVSSNHYHQKASLPDYLLFNHSLRGAAIANAHWPIWTFKGSFETSVQTFWRSSFSYQFSQALMCVPLCFIHCLWLYNACSLKMRDDGTLPRV